MKKSIIILGSIISGLAVGTPALAQTHQDTNQQVVVQGLNSIVAGLPVGTSAMTQTSRDSDRQVVVLELMIYADKGRTVEAQVSSSRRINSYAPKVFARRGGDWKVVLHGDRGASFTVNDPASDVEIENPRGYKSPYSEVAMSGYFSTTLVVPLYGLQGEWLGAKEIEIIDIRTDETILWTTIR